VLSIEQVLTRTRIQQSSNQYTLYTDWPFNSNTSTNIRRLEDDHTKQTYSLGTVVRFHTKQTYSLGAVVRFLYVQRMWQSP